MELQDILTKAQAFVDKLNSINTLKWKGNDAPNKHHWDAGSIVPTVTLIPAEGLEIPKVSVSFVFKDNGAPHVINALCAADKLGVRGGGDEITFDGVAVNNDDFVLGHREGLEGFSIYARIVCEFKFELDGVTHDYRFDGG